jgi:RNA polymerase sigma factor (sigma-70 family)
VRFEATLGADDKQLFVHELAREHGQRLRRFLAARLRQAAADVPDLVQEVYLRLLRVPSSQTIRSPRAYLFTVAMHVLHQHKLSLATTPEAVDIAEVLSELEARGGENPASHLEVCDQLEEFDRVLKELSPQAYAVFVLHRQYGYSREEIAARLGLSLAMVKKHLAVALAHCRRRFEEMEQG